MRGVYLPGGVCTCLDTCLGGTCLEGGVPWRGDLPGGGVCTCLEVGVCTCLEGGCTCQGEPAWSIPAMYVPGGGT